MTETVRERERGEKDGLNYRTVSSDIRINGERERERERERTSVWFVFSADLRCGLRTGE